MQIPDKAPVVVAVSGSSAGLAAVRLAAREAAARGLTLLVLHAFSWPGTRYTDDPPDYGDARHEADQIVNEAMASARRSAPGVPVKGKVADGLAVRELLIQSRRAALLVLGDDALAGGMRLPADSVLVQVVSRARCPVVVARGVRPPSGPMLAAVDGSPSSMLALRLAAAEAQRRQIPLDVAHVVGEAGEAAGSRLLQRMVDEIPGIPRVRPQLLIGEPASTLLRASRRARMMVVGPRGTDGSSLLGAVASELLRRCACPTVFVHGTPAGHAPVDGTVPSAGALIS
ncbi:universal stress protein [Winogradskya humida]|uniref:Universal stress protein n=1 Tax=Winogradskya humida TaxID=113566 RepID=A0ABQ3ZV35_9ACTN|nr:universal stress protein [Actinoplanes humidus]GIE22439.1 universal stress protein [Actinoplanes humidus]